MAFPMYEVTVEGFPPVLYAAATPAKARTRAWHAYTSAYECSFRDFLKISTLRRCGIPEDDGYVRRNYGIDVRIGQRVRLKEEGRLSRQCGEVIYPGRSTAHVHVVLDGDDHPVIVHPANVDQAQSEAS